MARGKQLTNTGAVRLRDLETVGVSFKEDGLVSVLFKFEMFLLILHVGGLCALLVMTRSAPDPFNSWLISGALCFYFGALLSVFDQAESYHDWEVILQSLANISLAGIPLPFMLIFVGALLLGIGLALRKKDKNAR